MLEAALLPKKLSSHLLVFFSSTFVIPFYVRSGSTPGTGSGMHSDSGFAKAKSSVSCGCGSGSRLMHTTQKYAIPPLQIGKPNLAICKSSSLSLAYGISKLYKEKPEEMLYSYHGKGHSLKCEVC
jgi:hypothetical protein